MGRAFRLALALALACPLSVGPGLAEAPATSLRPEPRPAPATALTPAPDTAEPAPVAAQTLPRPKRRPDALTLAAPAAPAGTSAPVATVAPLAPPVLRPKPRPEGLIADLQLAAAPMPAPEPAPKASLKKKKKEKASTAGSVCGDPAIKGEALAPIKGKVKGCGVDKPVRVTAISGIRLNQPATISCEAASAFKTWIEQGLRPAMGKREVVEIRIAASYVCRPRNNQKGAKVSEHGRGHALDVAGLVFSDGTQWSVAQNYGKELRRAHKAACGIFGTTLGPGSDGYHEDHLHFDTAGYRSGPYCR